MEVHAHSHTERKKWTHYFWEFFMLFLAVTLGFLVENRRDHFMEHIKEKEYAHLLYDDLKKDTAWLFRVTTIKRWKENKIDSLLYFLTLPDLQKNATSIYYYSSFLNLDNSFTPNDATIQQLRNSGSLRYFSNLGLYNAITSYYNDCSFYQQKENERKTFFPLEIRTALFNANDYSSLSMPTPSIMDVVQYPKKEMYLISADRPTINKFIHYINDVKLENKMSILFLDSFIKDELNRLIITLKKEYDLGK
jgi:hypothetical protein